MENNPGGPGQKTWPRSLFARFTTVCVFLVLMLSPLCKWREPLGNLKNFCFDLNSLLPTTTV